MLAPAESRASTVVITGSSGRIGRLLTRRFPGSVGIDLPDVDLRCTLPQLPRQSTVIALAAHPDGMGPYETAWCDNMAILANTIRACDQSDVRRLVFASSVWTEHRAWGLSDSLTWYAAAKQAGEILCRAWTEAAPGRICTALRIGGYDPDAAPALACRVDDATLMEAFDDAVACSTIGFSVHYAVGTKPG